MFDDKSKHPLCWPDTWPRAPFRHSGRFGERSVSVAFGFLVDEMRRLGCKSWLMSSNIPRSKRDGIPLSNLSQPKDPGVAIYFTVKDKPVSLACDKWTRVEDNIWAIAKHIEALRGQERWGVGTMEQAFRGYMALPGVGETGGLSWWKVLGVPINATFEQSRQAYLNLVKKHHPDRLGDPEAFVAIQQAWEQFEKVQKAI